MAFYCQHCGSRNHRAIDCSKKHLTYTPTAEELAEMAPAAPAAPPPAPPAPEPPAPRTGLGPPRWPGGPPTCLRENLGAFATREEMRAFADSLLSSVTRTWECDGHWHFESKRAGPGQDSHRTPRPKGRDFMRASTRRWREGLAREAVPTAASLELPAQPRPAAAPAAIAAPARKTVDRPAPKVASSDGQASLF